LISITDMAAIRSVRYTSNHINPYHRLTYAIASR
jgi:hypothetical protein